MVYGNGYGLAVTLFAINNNTKQIYFVFGYEDKNPSNATILKHLKDFSEPVNKHTRKLHKETGMGIADPLMNIFINPECGAAVAIKYHLEAPKERDFGLQSPWNLSDGISSGRLLMSPEDKETVLSVIEEIEDYGEIDRHHLVTALAIASDPDIPFWTPGLAGLVDDRQSSVDERFFYNELIGEYP